MNKNDPTFLALQALCSREGGYEKVAEAIGSNATNLWQILNGTLLPSKKPRGLGPRLKDRISEKYPDWLQLGFGGIHLLPNPAQTPGSSLTVNNASKVPVALTGSGQCAIDCESHVHVPLLDNSCSMGQGMPALSEDVFSGQLLLVPNWVHTTFRPSSDNALRFIHAYGDSMSPTFSSGDVLLVDTGINFVQIDGIYAMRAHDRLFIKRVRQRMDGTFEISSDNPNHKTTDTLGGGNEVTVLGRVLWVWNGRRV